MGIWIGYIVDDIVICEIDFCVYLPDIPVYRPNTTYDAMVPQVKRSNRFLTNVGQIEWHFNSIEVKASDPEKYNDHNISQR